MMYGYQAVRVDHYFMSSECRPHTNAYGCVRERKKGTKDEREKNHKKQI